MSEPIPSPAPGVETKVKVATAGSYLGGVAGLALVALLSDGTVLALLPQPWTTLLAPLVPAVVAFLTSYLAAHTPRKSDLGAAVDAQIEAKVADAVEVLRGELGKHQAGKSLPPLGGDKL